MPLFPTPPHDTRLGFYYFPDANHYREGDLHTWRPELASLGVTWLILVASPERAIPEAFLRGLLDHGIEPILHFSLPPEELPPARDLDFLFSTYARWGVHYVILFDKPNSRNSWSPNAWAQSDLVERFMDRFIPLAKAAHQSGLFPTFAPLDPGGDYWDTAFLRAALQALLRRGHCDLLQDLVIAAYAYGDERPLNWGCGGPESWPGAQPYFTPPGEEDQLGFRIFDWYAAISQAVIGKNCPMILIGSGGTATPSHISALHPLHHPKMGEKGGWGEVENNSHTRRNLAIASALAGVNRCPVPHSMDPAPIERLEPVPTQVLAFNFWLLSAAPGSPHLPAAWFKPDGTTLPIVDALRRMLDSQLSTRRLEAQVPSPSSELSNPETNNYKSPKPHLIAHYLLLPSYEWGVADWHLETIRPFVKKYRPTVGFSLSEAALAARVTVIGGPQLFPEEALSQLRASGCVVERISGDGTSIATQFANR